MAANASPGFSSSCAGRVEDERLPGLAADGCCCSAASARAARYVPLRIGQLAGRGRQCLVVDAELAPSRRADPRATSERPRCARARHSARRHRAGAPFSACETLHDVRPGHLEQQREVRERAVGSARLGVHVGIGVDELTARRCAPGLAAARRAAACPPTASAIRSNSSNRRGIVSPDGSKFDRLVRPVAQEQEARQGRRQDLRDLVSGGALALARCSSCVPRCSGTRTGCSSGGSWSKTRRAIASARSRDPPAVARSLPQPSIVAPTRPQRAAQSTFQTILARPPNGETRPRKAAPARPIDMVRATVIGDVRPVPVVRCGGPDLAAVLADHADRQPARGMVDRRDGPVDLEDHIGSVESTLHVRVHRTRGVVLGHPVEAWVDAQIGERLEEQRREVSGVVGVRGTGRARERARAVRPCTARPRRA